MDQQPQADKLFNNIEIDAQANSFFAPLLKWAKITAIIGLINVAMMFVSYFMKTNQMSTGPMAAFTRLGLFVLIPFAAVIVLINVFLLLFANNTKQGIDTMSQAHLNQGISNLRYYLKTIGIVIIVGIGLAILFMFAALIGVGMRA